MPVTDFKKSAYSCTAIQNGKAMIMNSGFGKAAMDCAILLVSLVLQSCSQFGNDEWYWLDNGSGGSSSEALSEDKRIECTDNTDDYYNENGFTRDVTVVFSGATATVSGAPAELSVGISGACVVLDYQGDEHVRYTLKGQADNGTFKLYSQKKQAIVLDGCSIHNESGAALNNQSHKRTFIILKGENSLQDGGTDENGDYPSQSDNAADEDMKAALFSEGQLVFSGDGSLAVTAIGKSAIVSDDYVRIMEGPSISVTSSLGHGIRGKSAVILGGGILKADVSGTGKKAVASDSLVLVSGGTAVLSASGDAGTVDGELTGAACIRADQLFVMDGGSLTLSSSGTGGKGISGDGDAWFQGGELNVTVTGSNYGNSGGGGFPGGGGGGGGFPGGGGGGGFPGGGGFRSGLGMSDSIASTAMGAPVRGDIDSAFFPGPGGPGGPMGFGGPGRGDSAFFPGPGGPGGPGGPMTRGGMTRASDNSSSAKGIKFDGNIYLTGTTVYVSCASHEAIESKSNIYIGGGKICAISSDDAINSSSDMIIEGGAVVAVSSGNDGLDSNGNMYIKGGTVYAVGCGTPEVAVDANTEGGKRFYLTGGTLIAIGGIEQGSSLTQAVAQTSWARNTCYALYADGETVPTVAFKTPSSGGSGLYVSLPGMQSGSSCTLKTGVTVEGDCDITPYLWLTPTVSDGNATSLGATTSTRGGFRR